MKINTGDGKIKYVVVFVIVIVVLVVVIKGKTKIPGLEMVGRNN